MEPSAWTRPAAWRRSSRPRFSPSIGTYYVYLYNLILDVAGNPLGSSSSSFVTGFSTDTFGPTLRLANPQSGDTNVGRNVKIVLQFDRAINAATLGTGILVQTDGVAVPGTFVRRTDSSACASRRRTRCSRAPSYVVTLTSELRDVSGNALTNPGTISFTSGPDERHDGANGDGQHAVLQPDRGRPAAGYPRERSARRSTRLR